MNQTSRNNRILAISFSALGGGIASIAAALLIYFTRYSAFDALYGEVDMALYLQVTAMSATEKVVILVGVFLLVTAILAIVAKAVLTRSRKQ